MAIYKKSVAKLLKNVIQSVLDDEENVKANVTHFLKEMNVSDARVQLLKQIVVALRDNPDFVNEETRLYLFNPGFARSDVNTILQARLDTVQTKDGVGKGERKIVNPSTTNSKITQGIAKIEKALNGILERLVSKDAPIDDISAVLFNISKKQQTLRSGIVLEVPLTVFTDTISEEDFQVLKMAIAPYTALQMKEVVKSAPKKLWGYFNKLSNGINLSEQDRERLSELMEMIGVQDDN